MIYIYINIYVYVYVFSIHMDVLFVLQCLVDQSPFFGNNSQMTVECYTKRAPLVFTKGFQWQLLMVKLLINVK